MAPPNAFAVMDYGAATQRTVEAAARRVAEYYRLCTPSLTLSFNVRDEGGQFVIDFELNEFTYSRQWSEFVVMLFVARARRLSGRADIRPTAVAFQHKAPTNCFSHQEMLCSNVSFMAPVTEVHFSHDVLRLEIPGADPVLSSVVHAYASDRLARLPAEGGPRSMAAEVIRRILAREAPTTSAVAKEMGCSVRTLQARLKAEGTSFGEVLADERRTLAVRLLENREIRIKELPYLLQYRDARQFFRAFVKWTGTTPTEYRRRTATEPLPVS
jgi:AraC-like DNA-binding protein